MHRSEWCVPWNYFYVIQVDKTHSLCIVIISDGMTDQGGSCCVRKVKRPARIRVPITGASIIDLNDYPLTIMSKLYPCSQRNGMPS